MATAVVATAAAVGALSKYCYGGPVRGRRSARPLHAGERIHIMRERTRLFAGVVLAVTVGFGGTATIVLLQELDLIQWSGIAVGAFAVGCWAGGLVAAYVLYKSNTDR